MVKQYGHMADFVIVYTREIHPTDEWAFNKTTFSVRQAVSLEQRVQAATHVSSLELSCPLMVDNMDDEAARLYGSMPERLFIVLDGKVLFRSEWGPMGYRLEEVEKWLNTSHRKK